MNAFRSSEPPPARWSWLGWALLPGLLLTAQVWWLALPTIDDAAISIAYGQNIWRGFGSRLTPRSQIVEGFTSPLWTLWTGLSAQLPVYPLAFAKWSGTAVAALAFAWLVWLACKRGVGPWAALALCFLCGFPSFAYWVGTGMEVGLHLLAIAALLSLSLSGPEWGFWKGVALGAAVLVRPELTPEAALFFLVWAAPIVSFGRLAPLGRALLGGVLSLGTLLAFRVAYFASLLPNTYYAKLHLDFHYWNYVGAYATHHWPLIAAFVLGSVALLWKGERRLPAALAIAAGWPFVFTAVARGDWMAQWRFLATAAPFLVLPAAFACSKRNASGRARFALPGIALAVLAFGSVRQYPRHRELKNTPELPAEFIRSQFEPWLQRVEALGVRRPLMGFPDIGASGLLLQHGELIDVAGLGDYAIARAQGQDVVTDYLLHEGPPEMLDAHGPSAALATPGLQAHFFKGWSWGSTVMTGLTAEEDPRCPGSKTRLLRGEDYGSSLRSLLAENPVAALRYWRCVIAYVDDAHLPDAALRAELVRTARAKAAELRDSAPETALRYLSIVAVLTESRWERRRAEKLRNQLFGTRHSPSDVRLR